MTSLFQAAVLTLFPEMFPGPLGFSLAGKALEKDIWDLHIINIRDFATDKHKTVDDTCYGGGTGMVMKPDVLDRAIQAAKQVLSTQHSALGTPTLIYPSPRGVPMTQKLVTDLMKNPLIILCGRFEGVDERVLEAHNALEVSLGDFILSGGEIAAYALLDAAVRLLPGVIGDENALSEESFGNAQNYAGLLEYPHYTKPPIWEGRPVPEVLLSGNHEEIRRWRLQKSQAITQARRPDLWEKYDASTAPDAAKSKRK